MRPKFVIALFGVAFLVVGTALILKQHLGDTLTSTRANSEITGIRSTKSNLSGGNPSLSQSVSHPLPAVVPVPTTPPLPAILTPEERQAAADAEIDRLQDWSLNTDPASLSNILADLTYPDKRVREAAIEAVKQFGSSNAVSTLRDLAANDEDPAEKADLLEAADFLSLPPLEFGGAPKNLTPEQSQTVEQMRAARLARQQAWQEARSQNRNLQSESPPSTSQNPPKKEPQPY